MERAAKQELAKQLTEKFGKAKVALFADYKGLTSVQADELRKQVRATEGEVKVLKNNVARLITREGQMGDDAKSLMDEVVGPTLVAFSYADAAATAKAFHKFSKDNEALKIKDSLMGQKRVLADEIEALATLPPREVLLAKLLGSLNAPASNFVGVLAAVPRSLLNVLVQIEGKKKDGA